MDEDYIPRSAAKKEYFPTWIIILIVIAVAVVSAVLIPVLLHKTAAPHPPPPVQIRPVKPPVFTDNSNPGISNNGLFGGQSVNGSFFRDALTCTTAAGSDRRYWSREWMACQCQPPYWGDQCQREAYSKDFFAAGRPAAGDIQSNSANITSTFPMRNLSFPSGGSSESCTSRCQADPACTGVYWRSNIEVTGGVISDSKGTVGGNCTLLTGNISINSGKSIPFDPNVDSTLYLKDYDSRPAIPSSVFLIRDNVPLRYWLYDRQVLSAAQEGGPSSLLQVQKGRQYQLDFIPTTVINNGNLTGVYSNVPLSTNIQTTLTEAVVPKNGVVLIHQPGTALDTSHPVHSGGQVWVTYV